MQNKSMRGKYGSFYQEQHKLRGRQRLINPLMFYVRRLILVFLVVKGADITFAF